MFNDATNFKRIFIACGYTDLRRGIDGLAATIKNDFHMDPYEQGNIFLFCGRRTDRMKALVYEGDGFVLAYRRLANGRFQWPRNQDEVYKGLEYQPARFVVHEHHIAVYAGNGDTGVVRADRPDRLLKNSILTTSLAAGIFEGKYVNHSPYNRIEANFKCKNANIARQNMAG